MSPSILVVDDDFTVTRSLARRLDAIGYDVHTAVGGKTALSRLESKPFDLLLVDLVMPEIDGFEVMHYALRKNRSRSVIVVSGSNTIPKAVAAMREGASNFIPKPVPPNILEEAVQEALGAPKRECIEIDGSGWRQKYAPDIVGSAAELTEVLRIVSRVASTACSVLVTGPSGSGKELIARAIHDASGRGKNPFVAVNCAAIPSELMESEIFGHAKGAFTGATERREGRFQVADGGTLFLDEIGEMDLSLQSKLLRVLQEQEVTSVGDTRAVRVDVRIVAATNQDLLARCKEGLFREDLYYRLNVIPVQLPSLAERSEDIPELVHHFVDQANETHQRKITGVTSGAMECLQSYAWPGNIRELENLMERTVLLKAGEGPIELNDLPPEITGRRVETMSRLSLPEKGLNMRATLEALEVKLTRDALKRSGGNKARAAELLGLKRTTLIERLKKLDLEARV